MAASRPGNLLRELEDDARQRQREHEMEVIMGPGGGLSTYHMWNALRSYFAGNKKVTLFDYARSTIGGRRLGSEAAPLAAQMDAQQIHQKNTRFVVFYCPVNQGDDHCVGFVIDNYRETIHFLDPLANPLSEKMKDAWRVYMELREAYLDYTVIQLGKKQQYESWSCCVHTYLNIQEVVAHEFIDEEKPRDVRVMLEKILIQSDCYQRDLTSQSKAAGSSASGARVVAGAVAGAGSEGARKESKEPVSAAMPTQERAGVAAPRVVPAPAFALAPKRDEESKGVPVAPVSAEVMQKARFLEQALQIILATSVEVVSFEPIQLRTKEINIRYVYAYSAGHTGQYTIIENLKKLLCKDEVLYQEKFIQTPNNPRSSIYQMDVRNPDGLIMALKKLSEVFFKENEELQSLFASAPAAVLVPRSDKESKVAIAPVSAELRQKAILLAKACEIILNLPMKVTSLLEPIQFQATREISYEHPDRKSTDEYNAIQSIRRRLCKGVLLYDEGDIKKTRNSDGSMSGIYRITVLNPDGLIRAFEKIAEVDKNERLQKLFAPAEVPVPAAAPARVEMEESKRNVSALPTKPRSDEKSKEVAAPASVLAPEVKKESKAVSVGAGAVAVAAETESESFSDLLSRLYPSDVVSLSGDGIKQIIKELFEKKRVMAIDLSGKTGFSVQKTLIDKLTEKCIKTSEEENITFEKAFALLARDNLVVPEPQEESRWRQYCLLESFKGKDEKVQGYVVAWSPSFSHVIIGELQENKLEERYWLDSSCHLEEIRALVTPLLTRDKWTEYSREAKPTIPERKEAAASGDQMVAAVVDLQPRAGVSVAPSSSSALSSSAVIAKSAGVSISVASSHSSFVPSPQVERRVEVQSGVADRVEEKNRSNTLRA